MSPPRVVSLLPSATEILCALGAVEELVGISHECDFPAEVRGRTVLTRSRISNALSSRDIDASVRDVLLGALSIYAIDERALGELQPTLIVTQDLCEVCAVSLDDVKSAVARLSSNSNVDIVCLQPTRLTEVFDDVERVAAALGRNDAGALLRERLSARIDAIRERAAPARARPRVVSVEWLEPLMLGGLWMPELIELAAGTAVGARAAEPAPTLSPTELRGLEPDVVVFKPCGFGIQRTLDEAPLNRGASHGSNPSIGSRVRGGRQCLLQPARPAPSRVARNHGGVRAP
ncbi:MAG: BtuF-related (seleno)protein [Polyangiaceae bacterium]